MASWACSGCRTVYAVGIPACPHCGDTGYSEDNGDGGTVAKASAEGGATSYVAEGDPVPDDLPDGVRLVGPGAPTEPDLDVPMAAVTPEEFAAFTVKHGVTWETPDEPGQGEMEPDGEEEGPADYASLPVAVLRELAKERGITIHGTVKADLVSALQAWDAGHPDAGEGGD